MRRSIFRISEVYCVLLSFSLSSLCMNVHIVRSYYSFDLSFFYYFGDKWSVQLVIYIDYIGYRVLSYIIICLRRSWKCVLKGPQRYQNVIARFRMFLEWDIDLSAREVWKPKSVTLNIFYICLCEFHKECSLTSQ
jgi:hypothetical protein